MVYRNFINIEFHLDFRRINLYGHTNTSNYETRKDFLFYFLLQVVDGLEFE